MGCQPTCSIWLEETHSLLTDTRPVILSAGWYNKFASTSNASRLSIPAVQTIHVLSEARILIALCRVVAAFKGELPTDAYDGNGASVRAIPMSNAESEGVSSLFAIDGSDSILIELRASICRMVPRVADALPGRSELRAGPACCPKKELTRRDV